jgi:hypothetical protein
MIITKNINIPKLQNEISVSYPEIQYITRVGDEYHFEGIVDENVLTSIIDAHDPSDVYFRITGDDEDPSDIDYSIRGYHKEKIFNFGELNVVNYYENYNGSTFSDIVVKEERYYHRDVTNNLVEYRSMTHSFYYNNDQIGIQKNTIKYYTLEESIQESRTKRDNIINQTKAYVLVELGRMISFDLLSSIKSEMELFLDGYTTPLVDAIQNSTKPYLTQTIKDNIEEKLRLE